MHITKNQGAARHDPKPHVPAVGVGGDGTPNLFRGRCSKRREGKGVECDSSDAPEEIIYNTVRGQYSEGIVDGERVVGYREEPGVSPTSARETYAALKLFIENWRWAGVPFSYGLERD